KLLDEDIRYSLANITGIDVGVLESIVDPRDTSIATRMKWASYRETTRPEDVSYCLMGLFDVNMPLLYGEGRQKAFIRLQEEILKTSSDHSIFMWRRCDSNDDEIFSGLLAESPQYFSDAENYKPMPPLILKSSNTWNMTNQGLQLALFLKHCLDDDGIPINDEYDAVLECTIRQKDDVYHRSPAIRVKRIYGDQFARIEPHIVRSIITPSFGDSQSAGAYEILFVKQAREYPIPQFMVSWQHVSGCELRAVWPERNWDEDTGTLLTTPQNNLASGLFRFFFLPWCGIAVDYVVGLKRKPGGIWGPWQLLRLSAAETPDEALNSANNYRALILSQKDSPGLSLPGKLDREWREEVRDPRFRITIRETIIHGRIYNLIETEVTHEADSRNLADPPLPQLEIEEPRTLEFSAEVSERPSWRSRISANGILARKLRNG
ncbi:hypothetical protein F4777DRAFT_597870, partial [Nemania sp. FL0916]